MIKNSFKLIENESDVLFLKAKLSVELLKNILIGIAKQQKYIYYFGLNVLINVRNDKEIYIL